MLILVLGKPIPTSKEKPETIGPSAGVPIFGLDALRSAAYGPEVVVWVVLSANPQDMTHHDLALPLKPALERLGEIKVATLIVTDDADIPHVHAHSGAVEAGIPRARRVVMSGVGHILYLEKPTEFSRLTIEFLEENEH